MSRLLTDGGLGDSTEMSVVRWLNKQGMQGTGKERIRERIHSRAEHVSGFFRIFEPQSVMRAYTDFV